MIINFHISNTDNAGDLQSALSKYFDIDNMITANLMDFSNYNAGSDVIFGGGMLLKRIRENKILDYFSGIKVGWGIGDKRKIYEYDYASKFDILGTRDYGVGIEYVPCPSCLSPLFDNIKEPTREVVYYQNATHGKLSDKPSLGDNLLLSNNARFHDIIDYLSSGETIVSSSYHGVYWGMLMGRKVIAIPFNYKFHRFKYPVPLESLDSITNAKIRAAPSYSAYLEECRSLNIEFSRKVSDILNRRIDRKVP